jgi:hypothetical protein
MKKLSVIVSLSLMLSSLSWAEKYEFVRLSGDNAIVLNSGDIAWWVNSLPKRGVNLVQHDANGELIGNHVRDVTVNGGGIDVLEDIFIGPCSISSSRGSITLKILRTSESGYKTLEWDGSKYAGGVIQNSNNNNDNSSPVPDPSGIKYDQLLGWCYFTDTPWIYSYTNGSWYYMHSMQDGIYVWNANLPNDGWMKLHG